MSSIFTRIVNGEIPSAKVYEDDHTFAFMDINPASRGHTLVICKEEYADLLTTPAELVAAVAITTRRIAQAIVTALQPDGFNIVQNNGTAAGQVVFHYHVHIIPRWQGDRAVRGWEPGTATMAELHELASQISAQISAS